MSRRGKHKGQWETFQTDRASFRYWLAMNAAVELVDDPNERRKEGESQAAFEKRIEEAALKTADAVLAAMGNAKEVFIV